MKIPVAIKILNETTGPKANVEFMDVSSRDCSHSDSCPKTVLKFHCIMGPFFLLSSSKLDYKVVIIRSIL